MSTFKRGDIAFAQYLGGQWHEVVVMGDASGTSYPVISSKELGRNPDAEPRLFPASQIQSELPKNAVEFFVR